MKLHKCFFPIIIICIDDHKWFFYNILASQNRLPGSPRFDASLWNLITFWQAFQLLIDILNRHNFRQTISNYFFEFFLNGFPNYKNNLCKSSFFRIVNRKVHNNFSIRSHLSQLLDTGSKTGTYTGSHDDEGCVHVFLHNYKDANLQSCFFLNYSLLFSPFFTD